MYKVYIENNILGVLILFRKIRHIYVNVNKALEKVIRDSGISTKYTILNSPIQLLTYADDIAIISRTMERLKNAFVSLEKAVKNMGQKINESKTKYMYVFNRNHSNASTKVDIKINNYTFEGVSDFIYLGSLINTNNSISDEINLRICLANKTCFSLHSFLRSDVILRATKSLLYKEELKNGHYMELKHGHYQNKTNI